jgi:hypothetical protein
MKIFSAHQINVLDIQYLDFNSLTFERDDMLLEKNFNKQFRDQQFKTHLGFFMKISRENLATSIEIAMNEFRTQVSYSIGNLDNTEIGYFTKNDKDYKIIKRLMRNQMRTNFTSVDHSTADGTKDSPSKDIEFEDEIKPNFVKDKFELFQSVKEDEERKNSK